MKESNPKHSLNDYDFGELAKTESNARARTRLYILHRIGKHSFEIAENLSINIETARRTRRRYQASGLDSLYDKPRSGRNSKLAPEHIEAFKQLIVDTQAKRGGGRLTGQDIQKLAYEHYQAAYSVNGIYELLNRIGITWISARSQHPQANINAQEAFKKTSSSR